MKNDNAQIVMFSVLRTPRNRLKKQSVTNLAGGGGGRIKRNHPRGIHGTRTDLFLHEVYLNPCAHVLPGGQKGEGGILGAWGEKTLPRQQYLHRCHSKKRKRGSRWSIGVREVAIYQAVFLDYTCALQFSV